MIVNEWKEKKVKKSNLRQSFAMPITNRYYFGSGGGGGDVIDIDQVSRAKIAHILSISIYLKYKLKYFPFVAKGEVFKISLNLEGSKIQDLHLVPHTIPEA